jgi:hypothetical protein
MPASPKPSPELTAQIDRLSKLVDSVRGTANAAKLARCMETLVDEFTTIVMKQGGRPAAPAAKPGPVKKTVFNRQDQFDDEDEMGMSKEEIDELDAFLNEEEGKKLTLDEILAQLKKGKK